MQALQTVPPTVATDPEPLEAALCPHCDYDLRGTTLPRCPECGHDFNTDQLARGWVPWFDAETVGGPRAFFQTVWFVTFRRSRLQRQPLAADRQAEVEAFCGHVMTAWALTLLLVDVSWCVVDPTSYKQATLQDSMVWALVLHSLLLFGAVAALTLLVALPINYFQPDGKTAGSPIGTPERVAHLTAAITVWAMPAALLVAWGLLVHARFEMPSIGYALLAIGAGLGIATVLWWYVVLAQLNAHFFGKLQASKLTTELPGQQFFLLVMAALVWGVVLKIASALAG